MSKIRSTNGRRMNWLNYPTEIKPVFLRLVTEKNAVALCFDLQMKDASVRAVFWEQMTELKKVLTDAMTEPGEWIEHCSTADIPEFSRICWRKEGLNYYNADQQKEIFAFFEDKLVAFDSFYQDYKEILLFLAS